MDVALDEALQQQMQQLTTHGEVALTSFEALNAISTSEVRWRELNEQGKLTRMYKTLTGKNRKIEQAMQGDFITFQKCAQQSIELLAERQVLTIDLLVTMQRGQHFYQAENNRKFHEINQFLKSFLTRTQQQMNELSGRVDALEKTQKLLTWKATIKHQSFHGEPIVKLSNEAKVIYIATNFYYITNGDWHNEHTLLLETICDELLGCVTIDFRQCIIKLMETPKLLQHYFAIVPQYNVVHHQYVDGHVLFMLAAYFQRATEAYIVTEATPQMNVSLREIVFYFINGLAAFQAASQAIVTVAASASTKFQIVLRNVNSDDRIYIHSVLKKHLKMSVEKCRELTKNLPATLGTFDSLEEAHALKGELEKFDCVIELN